MLMHRLLAEFQSFGDQVAFLHEAIPWLERESTVERYAYFWANEGGMLSGGQLNAVGQAYIA